ncbi:MAG TPA: NAD-glutamate dehydrogenase, partial [Beijerinckiaceae bacterium]|nr:NAD-glutamate dehydrogenase [Beijerinckiaceae bacterium]
SKVPDDPYLSRELERYFPETLRELFPEAIGAHRLRREIIATQLANAIVNRGGPTIVTRLVDQTGADTPTIAAAYAATRDSFALSEINDAIDGLDGKIPGALQLKLYADVQELLLSRLVWFIRHADFARDSLDTIVSRYRAGVAEIEAGLTGLMSAPARQAWQERRDELSRQGVPDDVAGRLAALQDLVAAPDIVLVAQRTGHPVIEIAATHFAVDDLFQLGALSGAARHIPVTDYFDRLALDRAIDALAAAHRKLTAEVVAAGPPGPEAVAAWRNTRAAEIDRLRAAVDNIVSTGLTLSKLMVAASLLDDLAKG